MSKNWFSAAAKTVLMGGALMFASACPTVAGEAPSNVFAQGIDVEVGAGGVRVRPERDRFEERREPRERERFEERRRFGERERFEERRGPPERFVERRSCRTYVVKRRTEFGVRTSRVRRCG